MAHFVLGWDEMTKDSDPHGSTPLDVYRRGIDALIADAEAQAPDLLQRLAGAIDGDESQRAAVARSRLAQALAAVMEQFDEFVTMANGDSAMGADKAAPSERNEDDDPPPTFAAWCTAEGEMIGYGDIASCGAGVHGFHLASPREA
jgi:hypothetical protein